MLVRRCDLSCMSRAQRQAPGNSTSRALDQGSGGQRQQPPPPCPAGEGSSPGRDPEGQRRAPVKRIVVPPCQLPQYHRAGLPESRRSAAGRHRFMWIGDVRPDRHQRRGAAGSRRRHPVQTASLTPPYLYDKPGRKPPRRIQLLRAQAYYAPPTTRMIWRWTVLLTIAGAYYSASIGASPGAIVTTDSLRDVVMGTDTGDL